MANWAVLYKQEYNLQLGLPVFPRAMIATIAKTVIMSCLQRSLPEFPGAIGVPSADRAGSHNPSTEPPGVPGGNGERVEGTGLNTLPSTGPPGVPEGNCKVVYGHAVLDVPSTESPGILGGNWKRAPDQCISESLQRSLPGSEAICMAHLCHKKAKLPPRSAGTDILPWRVPRARPGPAQTLSTYNSTYGLRSTSADL